MQTRIIATLIVLNSTLSSFLPLQAEVLAYWRFEEGPLGANLPRGGLPDGVFYGVVSDSSGNENALSAWSLGGYAGYAYRSDVPTSTITQTGETNTLSVQNTDGYPVLFTSPEEPIHTITPKQWTIEASFKPEAGNYRTIVGRDSIGEAWEEYSLAALYFQILPGDAVAIKYCDLYGYWHQAVSAPGLIQGFNWPNTSTGHWYHMAAVCDGNWLTLYLNDVDAGTGYQLVAATDLTLSGSQDTTMTAGSGSGSDWVAGTWSVGRGLYNGGHTDRAYGFIDEVRISDSPLNPDAFLFAEEAEQPPSTVNPFRITSLGTSNSAIVDHDSLTGDDRGGIAISDSQVFYTGDYSTARFRTSDLGGGVLLDSVYDSMVSDLKTERVYLLGNGSTRLGSGGGLVTSLLGIDGETGYLNGERIDLSRPIWASSYGTGIFAGYGRIVLYSDNVVYSIELPSGSVRTLGLLSNPVHMSSENWAFWGVAENIGGETFLAYVKDSQTIVRTRVSDGLTLPIAQFESLSDMACFTVSVPLGRWYFHYEGYGQFGGLYETLGYADASFDTSTSIAPFFLVEPKGLTVVKGDAVSFDPVYGGVPPFSFQWMKDGTEIPSATNASLHIAESALSDAGAYTVVVSNADGSTTSAEAELVVVPEEEAIAIYNDPRYVYDDFYSPLRNVEASLRSLGFATTTFSNISNAASRFRRWVIPPLEYADPFQDLNPSDRMILSNFVQQGGSMIVLGDWSENSVRILNTVFGMDLQRNYNWYSDTFTRSVGTYGTEFHDDPDSISRNYDAFPLWSTSLPEGGRALFRTGSETAAALMEQGDGVIIYLGWNWIDAVPHGPQDNGWLQVLESAARQPAPLAPAPPLVVKQPESKDLLTGGSVTLRVQAFGSRPLSYQWSRDGSPIADATNSAYSISGALPLDAGSYQVTVSNNAGTAASVAALVRVGDIAFLTQLRSQTTITLGPAVFGVYAIATTDDLTYRWYKDGVLIEGATNEYLEVRQATILDVGTYTVEVANGNGLVVESSADLAVVPPKGGDVDFSFNPGSTFEGDISAMALQPDGKLLLAGGFTTFAGEARPGLARLNQDGSVDPIFMNGFGGVDGWLSSLLALPNGQVLIGGDFSYVNGEPRSRLAKLNPDGSLDDSFQNGMSRFSYGFAQSLAQQSDGKLLVGGYFESFSSTASTHTGLVRLNADGSFDEDFQSNVSWEVRSIAIQADGSILVGGYIYEIGGVQRNGIARLNGDGTLDQSFQNGMSGVDGYVHSVISQPDGKILIGGYFKRVNGVERKGVARLNANGSVDPVFQGRMNGVDFGEVYSLALQSDGKVLLGGHFQTVNGVERYGIARLHINGALDTTFQDGMGGVSYDGVTSLGLRPDGKVLIGGYFFTVNGQPQNGYAQLNTDGSLDPEFRPSSDGIYGEIQALALQPDGKLLIGGYLTSAGGLTRNGIARLNADGSLDESFQNEMTGVDFGTVHSMVLQPDGKVLIGGYIYSVNGVSRNGIARLNADGSSDGTFQNGMSGVDGSVHSLLLQPDGKVLIGGYFQRVNGVEKYGIARLNANGSLDSSFQGRQTGVDFGTVNSLALQPDGRVLIGGYFQSVNGVQRYGIARLLQNGALDTSFQNNMSGVDYGQVYSIALQSDGRVLIGGYVYSVNAQPRYGLARLNADGSLDDSFLDGMAGADSYQVNAVGVLPDGQILAGGYFQKFNGLDRHGIVQLNPDGSVNDSFEQSMDGVGYGTVSELAIAPDGKVIIGGSFTTVNVEAISQVARLWGGPPAPITITVQPLSQIVQQSDSAVLEITATGEPVLSYQWYREQEELSGQTNTALTLVSVQESDQAFYSVMISNPFGMVMSSNAFVTVNQPPVVDAGATDPLVISGNGIDAHVILDGSRSSDPDGDALDYAWFESGSVTMLAEGAVATPVLGVGTHLIELVVSDGALTSTNTVQIEVITASDAIALLRSLTVANLGSPGPLIAKLAAAMASLGRGNPVAAVNQLQSFQNQIRAQVVAHNPELAELLLQDCQEILNILTGGQINPGGQPHGRRVTLVQKSKSSMRMQYEGQPRTSYIIEASTNLVDWEMIGVMVSDQTGVGIYDDSSATKYESRYYRTVLP